MDLNSAIVISFVGYWLASIGLVLLKIWLSEIRYRRMFHGWTRG